MTSFRFDPNPIQWYEGMFLIPQHFQQADLRQRNVWQYHLSHLNPYYWGVEKLAIDSSKLVDGILKVLSLEAVLPDGTILFFPETQTDTLEVSLEKFEEAKDNTPFKVYLSLASDADLDAGNIGARYTSVDSQLVKDLNTGDTSSTITRLKPKISLEPGNPSQRSVAFPLCEVVRQGNKFSQTDFIPPQLRVTLDSSLGLLCLELTKRVRSKLAYLQGKINSNTSDAETAHMAASLEAIRQRLAVGLLTFEATFNTGSSHPYNLFQALSFLVAQTVALKLGNYPPTFSPYKNEDLRGSFEQLFTCVNEILDSIEESYITVPLTQKDRVYSVELKQKWNTPLLVFGARAQPGVSEDTLVHWIQEAVIASDSTVDTVQENRILGAPREIIHTAPHLNLIPSRGVVLFSVTNDQRFIMAGETLLLFNISDHPQTRPQQITLYMDNSS